MTGSEAPGGLQGLLHFGRLPPFVFFAATLLLFLMTFLLLAASTHQLSTKETKPGEGRREEEEGRRKTKREVFVLIVSLFPIPENLFGIST